MIWIGGCILAVLAILALWRISVLKKELAQFKRETYYNANRAREASREFSDSIEALKQQLQGVASGVYVPRDLILSGRLYQEMTAVEARNLISRSLQTPPANREYLLIDVGTQKDFDSKHIPGARLIPLEELETRFQYEISREMSVVIVYCQRGDRSRLACEFLSRQGYMNVFFLVDGLQHWTGPMIERESFQLIQVQSKSKELC